MAKGHPRSRGPCCSGSTLREERRCTRPGCTEGLAPLPHQPTPGRWVLPLPPVLPQISGPRSLGRDPPPPPASTERGSVLELGLPQFSVIPRPFSPSLPSVHALFLGIVCLSWRCSFFLAPNSRLCLFLLLPFCFLCISSMVLSPVLSLSSFFISFFEYG